MTINRLTRPVDTGPVMSQTERLKEAVDRGNAYLAGLGRNDVHWYVHEGQLCIGWKTAPRLALVKGA